MYCIYNHLETCMHEYIVIIRVIFKNVFLNQFLPY